MYSPCVCMSSHGVNICVKCHENMSGSFKVMVGWLVGCSGFNGPLRQYFSLYQAVSQREGERREKGCERTQKLLTHKGR